MKTHLPFADCIVWLRAEPALLQRAHCSSGTGVDEPDLLSRVSLMLAMCLHWFHMLGEGGWGLTKVVSELFSNQSADNLLRLSFGEIVIRVK